MAHVLNECRGRVWCDHDYPLHQDHDDRAREVRGEETIPTERLALVETGEREQTCIPDKTDGAFTDGRIRKYAPHPPKGDPRRKEEPLDNKRRSIHRIAPNHEHKTSDQDCRKD